MNVIKTIYYFFAPYTDSRERSVAIFFKSLTEHSSQSKTRSKLYDLLQRDIAVINLWTEYKYKGYKYLKKSERKKLYANLDLIANDFDNFRLNNQKDPLRIEQHVHSLNPSAKIDHEKIVLIQGIMDYFSPHRNVYEYKASSSFGRLLRNPRTEKLIGDCNQIVTLYIYIYSRYFDVCDLKARLLPEHVALHYGGIDIEATSGTFKNYSEQKGSKLMPIEEIVSINLLDTTDSYLATHEVAAEDFLQASRFAYILSHHRDIVKNNLEAAYGKLITILMKRNNYSHALKIAKASKDATLLTVVGNNGALHSMQKHDYTAARKFAAYALKRDDLIKTTYHNEGVHYYQNKQYQKAITAFQKTGDAALVQSCYEALFFVEQSKLGSNLTSQTIKSHASTVKRMHNYAKKSGNKQLVDSASALLKHL